MRQADLSFDGMNQMAALSAECTIKPGDRAASSEPECVLVRPTPRRTGTETQPSLQGHTGSKCFLTLPGHECSLILQSLPVTDPSCPPPWAFTEPLILASKVINADATNNKEDAKTLLAWHAGRVHVVYRTASI